SIRYDVGLCATAAITTTIFIDAGLFIERDKRLVVDINKVKRAQEKNMTSLDQEFDELCKKGETECISSKGCINATKVMVTANSSDQQFPSTIKEHYSVCNKGLKPGKPAQVTAGNLVYFMKKKGIDKSLKAIGGDSTNVNTGCERLPCT
ncbi:hypothetical protein E2320_004635, partial [Naja naja]